MPRSKQAPAHEASENTRIVYELFVENWRHYDALVWQIQSIAVALNGFLVAQAFGAELAKAIEVRAILMFMAGFFTFVLWIALVKHLLHQRAQDHNVLALRQALGVKARWFDFSRQKDVEMVMGRTSRIFRWAARQKAHRWLLFVMGFIALADMVMFAGIIARIW